MGRYCSYQAGWRNIQNQSKQEVFVNGHPVVQLQVDIVSLVGVSSSSKEEEPDPEEVEQRAEHEVRVFGVGRVRRRELALL